MANKLIELQQLGQSIWLDFISRDALRSGELAKKIEGGVLGMTSNPAIFEKSMGSGNAYDDDIRKLAKLDRSTLEIYETLALEDITAASDAPASGVRQNGRARRLREHRGVAPAGARHGRHHRRG